MKVRLMYGLFASLVFIACDAQKKENEKLKGEVIAIHDEVMPVMGELQTLQKDLVKEASELSQKDHGLHQQEIKALENTAKELEEAYNSMFIWMRQFEVEYEEMTDEEVSNYLKEQKEKVEKVNTDIKKALEKAENLIN
jgi:predicted phosphohydrolase